MAIATRITIFAVLGLFCAGAAYILLARGPAILIDMSGSLAQLLCF